MNQMMTVRYGFELGKEFCCVKFLILHYLLLLYLPMPQLSSEQNGHSKSV